jgi:hypothetical protein
MTSPKPTGEAADMSPDTPAQLDEREQAGAEQGAGLTEAPRSRIIERVSGTEQATAPAAPAGAEATTPGLSVKLEALRAFYGDAEQVKGIDL